MLKWRWRHVSCVIGLYHVVTKGVCVQWEVCCINVFLCVSMTWKGLDLGVCNGVFLYTYGVWWAWLSAQWSGCFNPFFLPLYSPMGSTPDRGNMIHRQKLSSGMLFVCVCVYVCTSTLEDSDSFCLSMPKTGRKLCGVTFVHAHKMWTSLLQKCQIQCDLVICEAKSVIVALTMLFNTDISQNHSKLPIQHSWSSY